MCLHFLKWLSNHCRTKQVLFPNICTSYENPLSYKMNYILKNYVVLLGALYLDIKYS